jgi:hypothetical protein
LPEFPRRVSPQKLVLYLVKSTQRNLIFNVNTALVLKRKSVTLNSEGKRVSHLSADVHFLDAEAGQPDAVSAPGTPRVQVGLSITKPSLLQDSSSAHAHPQYRMFIHVEGMFY